MRIFLPRLRYRKSNLLRLLIAFFIFCTEQSFACPLVLNTSFTPVSCAGGNNATAAVSVSGGSGNYTYSWNVSGTSANLTGLVAGSYTVTVTDLSDNCTATATISIPDAPLLTATSSFTNVLCFGGNTGTATVNPTGGTGTYTYLWNTSPAQTSATATGLIAGAYSVTITDANNCSITQPFTITEPAQLTATTSFTPVLCFGGNTGTAAVNATGGTGAYTYLWNTTPAQTSVTATTLIAGTYSVSVTDANSCNITKSITVTEPTQLTATTSSTPVLCFGGSTGTATVSATGGTGSYTYSWNTTPTQTTATATGLAAGTYSVTVTDANGCTITKSVTVTEPTQLAVTTSSTPVLCFGGNTGSATVNATGGAGTYTYSWNTSPLQTSATATALAAATYSVTVTDANNCTITKPITITQPTQLTATGTPVNLTCNNYGNGKAITTAAGGTPGYTYSWNTSPVQTSATATSLAAGSYTATITDANSCSTTVTVNVTEPPPVITSQTSKNVSCFGYNDGEAKIIPNGSKLPYVYQWTPNVGSNSTIFALTAGTYSVTVTDGNNCQQSTSIIITQPTQLAGTITSTNSSCNGVKDGSASVAVTGGITPYTYLWNSTPAQTTAIATNLGAGTYTVKVTDANNCEFYATTNVVDAPPVFISNSTVTKETCQQGNGKIAISVIGGTAPYTYSWNTNPAQTTSTAINLTAGSYSVTVSDSKNCTTSKTIAVTNQFTPPIASASTTNNISCFGLGDGKATATQTGGTAPYTYSWSPSGGSAAIASNLSAGTYSVIVKDGNNCKDTATVLITMPTDITLNLSFTNATCGLSDGTATLAPTGGTLPYTINWSNGATGSTASNLAPGTYSVTLTDANGCAKTTSVTIITANPLVLNATSTNITCSGAADGTATAIASGGSGTFMYSWAPSGGSNATATTLTQGSYTVTVTDASNAACTGTKSVTITEPAGISVPIAITNVKCFGANTGKIIASPTGGTGTYSYVWSNGASTATASNLSPGNYTVTVTDGNGCAQTANGTITENADITASATGVNILCFGQSTGQATVTAGGGVSPYTYSWSPSGGTGTIAANLTANTYTVTVTDNVGCTKTASIAITQPTLLAINTNKTDATCGSNNGSITATPSGGVAPYTYAWSSGGTGATESNLAPGSYTVTVTDNNGCTKTANVSIVVSNPLTASITQTNITCNAAANGTATVVPTGGTGSYTYSWSPGGYTIANPTGLTPATYTVTITDASVAACTINKTVTITEPNVLAVNLAKINVTCNGNNDGKLSSVPTGGTSPYTYSWSTGSTASSLTGLAPGFYSINVTDAKGCTASDTTTITQGMALAVTVNSKTNVTCFGLSNGAASVNVTGGTGTVTYSWSPSGGNTASASGLLAGTYTVHVNDANNCATAVPITITQPAILALTTNVTNASCGLSDGIANVSVTGGTTPYTYSWTSGSTTASATGLAPGSYTVTVTDSNNCSKSQPATITVGNPIVLTTSKTDLTCNGANDGTATVNAVGGTGTYNYSWAPGGASTATATGLSIGTYTVTVNDAVNPACTNTATVTINQPAVLTASISSSNISCTGLVNGSATITPTGGTTPYSYAWSNGGTGSSIANLTAGSYSVIVTDAHNCTTTQSTTIIEPPSLVMSVDTHNVTCVGANNGYVATHVGGGTPGYAYSWSPTNSTLDSIGNLGPGTYSVTVTDTRGCHISRTISLTQPNPIVFTPGQKDPACYTSNGEAWVSVSGGSGSFSYLWTPVAGTNDTLTGLAPGSYNVLITDNNSGCDTNTTITLAYPVITLSMNKTNVLCKNAGDGKAWVIASGATAPYTYLWTSGSVNDTATALVPGTYRVTVNDNAGCIKQDSIIITEPTILSLTKSSTNVSCFGGSNGIAGITASGATSPYTYSWSNGGGANTISGLTKGTYTVTLRDNNACTLIDSITITEPTKLTVHADSIITTCFGANNGQATALANGGTPGYTYAWSPGAATGALATSLAPGQYIVTATDNKGCTAKDTVMVTQPSPYVITMSKSNPNCGQSNGSAYVSVSGNNGGYTFLWSTASTNDTITNLPIGLYKVTITDSKGCIAKDSITLVKANPIAITVSSTNVKCKNANDGTATVIASGGSGGFLYNWNPGGLTTPTITNLAPGKYVVTVSDQANLFCLLTDSVVITEPTQLTSSINATNVTCFGNGNGTATVTASGGTSPYTYLWTTTSTATSINALIPNTYSVTVTDFNNCTSTSNVTITQPTVLSATADSINVTCHGFNNGQAFATASGGTRPYTYSWNPGNIVNDTAAHLAPGTYTVTVKDSNNCTTTALTHIIEPASIALTMSNTNTGCGLNAGTATVVTTGGSTPYTYLWNNSGTTSTINNLYKGTYTVTVTDINGCTKTDSTTLVEPDSIIISFTKTNVTCFGVNDGTANSIATGGSGSYNYLWMPGGNTGAAITNLAPGTYTLTVSNSANALCSTTKSIAITQPTVLTSALTKTNITCFADSNGIAAALGVGGTAPYTYSWLENGSTNDTIVGLKLGTYHVTITDANNCSRTDSVIIIQPSALTTATSMHQATCGNADGVAYASASGGVGGYTYSWSPILVNNDTLTSLLPGKYYVTITDANGCIAKDSSTITVSNSIIPALSSVPLTCFGDNDGMASATANGGSGNFTYHWMPGNYSTANIYNLSPGMYTVKVTDANVATCFATDSIFVGEPALLDVNVSLTKNGCTGSNVYIATANVTGGNGGNTYSWSSGGTAQIDSSLSPGTYIISIIDSKGCDTAKIFTINSVSSPFILPISIVNPKCNLANGSATANIFGGQTPYTYSWNTTPVQTTATATNLMAGTYTVTVYDAYNCSDSRTISLVNTAVDPNVIATNNPVVCFGSNTGDATAIANAGTPPYTYSWSPSGGTSSTADSLTAGTYVITVTDAIGCKATDTTVILQPTDISISLTSTSPTCFADSNATASAIVSGGIPGYVYSWSSGGSSLSETNLSAGTYYFTATDANLCVKTDSITITQPNLLVANASLINNVFCNGGNNGTVKVSTMGGTTPYTFNWSPTGGTDSIAASLAKGTYTVAIIDAHGCSTSDSITLTEPNPVVNIAHKNVSCFGGSNGEVYVTITGGASPYTYNWTPANTSSDTISNLPIGIYSVQITDSLGCTYNATDTVTEPTKVVITMTGTNVVCYGDTSGSVTVAVAGGIPNYSYSWKASTSIDSSRANLAAGTYTIYVTDANACLDSNSITLTQPLPLLTNTLTTNLICYNDSSGAASSHPTGGTAPYTYAWSTGSTDSTLATLPAGSYSITVSDSNACATTDTVIITQPAIISTTISQTNVHCNGGNDGTATVHVSGGTTPYTYAWSTASTDSITTTLAIGTYTIHITDAHGCIKADSTTITEPAPVFLTTSQTNVSCYGGTNGTASVSVTGGVGTYTYLWMPNGDTTNTIDSLAYGAYSITVSDTNGCTQTDTVHILQPIPIGAVVSKSDVSCFGGNNGTATASTSGLTGPYTYAWSPSGGSGNTAIFLTAQTYHVTITDVGGCKEVDSIVITQPPVLGITLRKTNATCGNADGTTMVLASGGTTPYSYSWNSIPVQTNDTASNLLAGTYTVVVTDNKGCTKTGTIALQDTLIPTVTLTKVDVLCHGAATGSITSSVANGLAPYTYTWSNSQTTPNITGLVTGRYTVTVEAANGCKTIATDSISEPTAIASTMAITKTNCGKADGKAVVTATGGTAPYTYLWNTTAIETTTTIDSILHGTYVVTITDSVGCTYNDTAVVDDLGIPTLADTVKNVSCFGGNNGTATVTATGGLTPYTYTWSTTPAQTTATATGLVIGTYSVKVKTPNGCIAYDTLTISQPTAIVLTASSVKEICGRKDATATVQASGGIAPYTYSWNSVPVQTTATADSLQAGIYTVTVKDSNNCIKTIKDTVTNIPGPKANFTLKNECVNTLAQFKDTSSTNTVTWNWSFGDTTFSALQNPSHTYVTAGNYPVKLVVSDTSNCTDSIIKTFVVYPAPNIVFTDSTVGCSPLVVEFTNSSTLLSGASYLWNFGDNTTSTYSSPSHVYYYSANGPNTFDISLRMISANGCTSSVTKQNMIQLYQPPKANFNVNPTTGDMVNPTIYFYDESVGNVHYTWNFGDGESSSLSNPIHAYRDTGSFTVCLTIENPNRAACRDSICRDVYIKPSWSFFIPNAFTPDGDFKNALFKGYGENITEFEMFIYDRWGALVNKVVGINNGWDGTHYLSFEECAMGVYTYTITLKEIFGGTHKYQGTVTLIK